jgi:phosphoglycolate phosphatase
LQNLKVKAVMIDLDGTLVHSAPEIARGINAMLGALSLPTLSAVQIEAYIGDGAEKLIKRALTQQSDCEPDSALFVQAKQLFFTEYAKVVSQSLPYPGVVSALKALKNAGYRLACVTNKPHTFTQDLLIASNLLPYFEVVVAGDTLAKKKPDPDQLIYCCEQFGVAVSEAVMVGDSKVDVAAARSAGCPIIAVSYGYNHGQPVEANMVDALVDDLQDVVRLLH